MKNKTVFLLGAGVSAQTIPIVSHWRFFAAALIAMIENFDDIEIAEHLNKILIMGNESLVYDTPDTFAKLIHSSRGSTAENLDDLKIFFELLILTVSYFPTLYTNFFEGIKEEKATDSYVMYSSYKESLDVLTEINKNKQIVDNIISTMNINRTHRFTVGNVDSRLVSFASELVDIDRSMYKIMSWNYDTLLEEVFAKFTKFTKSIDHSKNFGSLLKEGFVKHLNGFAWPSEKFEYSFSKEENKKSLRKMVKDILLSSTTIEFGWEKDNVKDLIDTDFLEGAKNLVMIGYSMPYYNRPIDEQILKHFVNCNKNIYIQDLHPDRISDLVNIFSQSLESNKNKATQHNIIKLDKVNRYFIPY